MIIEYEYPTIYRLLAEENHLLIAGAQGSGKSVALNGIIYYLLSQPVHLAFIDLKQVEMIRYKHLSKTIAYADTERQALALLSQIQNRMMKEYTRMKRKRLVKTDRRHTYIIIDEYAELMLTAGKQAETLIQSIAQLGRAAGYHLILATQCPIAKVISTPIKVNITAQLALHTKSKQDSRNILGISGAESLPVGTGIYYSPRTLQYERVQLPMIADSQINTLIKHF